MRKRELIWIAAVALAIFLWVGPVAAKRDALYQDYETMATIIDRVLDSYVEEVKPEQLFQGAYDGVMSTLDPYSTYLPPESKTDLDISTTGEFGGLGIEITVDERRVLTVSTPLEGTPAFFAGVRAGDKIVAIEGESTRPDPRKTRREILMDAVSRLRGPKGTQVTIRVFHPDDRTFENITITRDIIRIKSLISVKMLDDSNIGYIRMTQFQQKTAEDLDAAVEELQAKGMKGLVLDLRFNPGGLLDSAVAVADRFISNGVIVSTKGRAPGTQHTYTATREATYPDFPVALLISERSASASEILAGAMQDHKRAVVIGTRSFGKASVQSVFDLEDGRSAIKVTTARYYTPAGRLIHRMPDATEQDEWGIHPDIKVEMTLDETLELIDQWRKEHVLDQTKNGETPPAQPEEVKKPEVDDMLDLLGPAADTDEEDQEAKPEEEKPFVDRQLEVARSVLRGAILERERMNK